MKNTMKLLGIIALAALIGFSFASCKNGTTDDNGGGGEPTKFEGRWLNLFAASAGLTDFSYTFTGNNWSFNAAGSETRADKGTFTFTDTAITFVGEANGTWTQGYTLNDNVLTLADDGTTKLGTVGPFTKQ